jgi:hypothetical protein
VSNNLWDRQPWDTDTSYYIFQTYFLPMQPNERNLADAYRNYRTSQGGSKVSFKGKKIKPPGTWKNWFEGKNYAGQKPPGSLFENSVGWPARARAYDTYLSEQARKAEEDLWKQRQLQIRRTEWEAAQELFDRSKQMRRAPVFRQTSTDTVQEGGNVVNRTIIIEPADWKESDVTRTAEEASRLARKSAEMDQEKLSVGDWRQELSQAGIDPDFFYGLLVASLAAQEAGVTQQQVLEIVRSAATQRQP